MGRRRAVLHPRGRLRLLVQPRGDDSEVGHGRRSSATSCGTSARCGPTSSSRWHRRHGRRPAPPGVGDADARGVQRRGRPGAVPRADHGGAAAVAGEEAVPTAGGSAAAAVAVRGLAVRCAGHAVRRGARRRPRRQPRRQAPTAPVPARPIPTRSSPPSTPTSTTRSSAARSAKSAASRPACTCARAARRSAARRRHRRALSAVETAIAAQKDKDETSLFEGIDTSLESLPRFAGARRRRARARARAIARRTSPPRRRRSAREDPAAAVRLLARPHRGARAARAAWLDGPDRDAAVRDRLPPEAEARPVPAGDPARARRCASTRLPTTASIIAGQPMNVSVMVANRGADERAVTGVTFAGLDGQSGLRREAGRHRARRSPAMPTAHVPANAPLTGPYWERRRTPAARRSTPMRRSAFRSARRRSVARSSSTSAASR